MSRPHGYSINSAASDDSEDDEPLIEPEAVPPQCCSARLNLAVLMLFGFSVVYGLRVNLSVAMVAMVNTTDPQPAQNSTFIHACPLPPGTENTSKTFLQPEGTPQYAWNSETQGWLLGAFFFGYLTTQIPGGYLAGHYGGRLFLGLGVLGTAALTLLTPLAAQFGSRWLFALRALEGFGEGVTFPAMMAMWARWAPPMERSRLMTLSGSGASFGTFLALPLTGFICQTLGWPAVFYLCGYRSWLVRAPAAHAAVCASVGDHHHPDVFKLGLLHPAHLSAHLHERHPALRPPVEWFPVCSAVPRKLVVLHAVRGRSRQPHREEGVQRHRRTQDLHTHRDAAACSFPRGCELRRLQPHPHRHLPHTVLHRRRDQLRRSLHEPDRHRSSVCRISSGNHQHVRDHSWCHGTNRYGILHRRSHPAGLEDGVLGRGRDQRRRRSLLHDIWQREDSAVGRHGGGEGRGQEKQEQVHLNINMNTSNTTKTASKDRYEIIPLYFNPVN
ncbi:uncharacterized protein [Trachinotus anak]|uniref:uncharacterized protein isoform X2 n=1 Tax=Trachinotus anak TaxID=443729 RepID=UPI0039F227E8